MEIQHKLAAFCCLLYTRIVATTAKKSPQTELIFIQLFQMFLLNKPLSTLKNPWQVSHMRFSSLRFFNDANSLYEIFINTPSHLLLLSGSAGEVPGKRLGLRERQRQPLGRWTRGGMGPGCRPKVRHVQVRAAHEWEG